MALPKRVAHEIMADLDLAAQDLENAGYPGLADAVDEAQMALYVFGPEAEAAVEKELARVDAAFEYMEARKAAKAGRSANVQQRGSDLRSKVERAAAKWEDSDGQSAYERMRKERRLPEIGQGVTALRRARMERLGLSKADQDMVRRFALDRFIS